MTIAHARGCVPFSACHGDVALHARTGTGDAHLDDPRESASGAFDCAMSSASSDVKGTRRRGHPASCISECDGLTFRSVCWFVGAAATAGPDRPDSAHRDSRGLRRAVVGAGAKAILHGAGSS